MNSKELREARGRLEAFVDPLLPLLGRAERRHWGAFYVQGLLLEGGRKTAAGMAKRYGGDEQGLQQFVNQSPWDWMSLRQEMAVIMAKEAGPRVAWVLDDTGFPKKGRHSVGVRRQQSPVSDLCFWCFFAPGLGPSCHLPYKQASDRPIDRPYGHCSQPARSAPKDFSR